MRQQVLVWTMGLSLVVSCGHVISAGDAGSTAVEAELTAIDPSIANTDDVITLEGTFDDIVTVPWCPSGDPAVPPH